MRDDESEDDDEEIDAEATTRTARRRRRGTRTVTARTVTARTRTSRRFRRLEQRAATTAPIGIAWTVGVGLGGAAGVVFHLWEELALRAVGVAVPTGDARRDAFYVSAALGAVLGAWAAAPGLYGPRWATTAAVTLAGWVGAGVFGAWVAGWGLPAPLGVAVALVAAVMLGQLAGRLPAPAWAHQGLATALTLAVAVGVPLHLTVLPGPGTSPSVLTTGLVLAFAATLGCGAAGVARADRAPFLPVLAGGALALALSGLVAGRDALQAEPVAHGGAAGPKVAVVVLTGLRADRVGRGLAPRLDALARQGTVYTEAHATSDWTVPSLASILTGRFPYEHGAGLNGGSGNLLTALRPDVPTVARVASQAGLATVASVSDPGLRSYALDAGFDRWLDDPGRGARPVALLPLAAAGIDPTGWPARAPAERVVERALQALATLPDSGWLLLVQLGEARTGSLTATPDAVGRYDDAVRSLDPPLGRLLDAVPDDAWVVVCGDRGVALGEVRHPDLRARTDVTWGHDVYQSLVHVPLVVRPPTPSPAASTRRSPSRTSRRRCCRGCRPATRPASAPCSARASRGPCWRSPPATAPSSRWCAPGATSSCSRATGAPRCSTCAPTRPRRRCPRARPQGQRRARARAVGAGPAARRREGRRPPRRARVRRASAASGPACSREAAVSLDPWLGRIGTEVIWLAVAAGFALIAATLHATLVLTGRDVPPWRLLAGAVGGALAAVLLARAPLLGTFDPGEPTRFRVVTAAVVGLVGPLLLGPSVAVTLGAPARGTQRRPRRWGLAAPRGAARPRPRPCCGAGSPPPTRCTPAPARQPTSGWPRWSASPRSAAPPPPPRRARRRRRWPSRWARPRSARWWCS
ncbi:MAG: sulfatase-like hydrolase/transferase [Myxococcota bacterium]